MKFFCLKYFPGLPRTGGEMVFYNIFDAVSRVRETRIKPFPLENVPRMYVNRLPFKMMSILIRNYLSMKYVASGVNVYSGLFSGTFEYFQPGPFDMSSISVMYREFLGSFEKVSRLKKVNLQLALYASEFVKENYRVKGVKNEFIVNPPFQNTYENDMSEKRNMVLTISRIDPSKNLEFIGELSKRYKVKFVILGYLEKSNTNYYQKLKRDYPDLEILPNASDEDKRKYLGMSKIYLHSATGEAFSASKLEAMSAGCIPLVPYDGGAREGLPQNLVYSDLDDLYVKFEDNLNNYSKSIGMEMLEASRKYGLDRFKDEIAYYVDNYMD